MNDKQLDDHLKNGKSQAAAFFTHAQPDSVRKAVVHKVQVPGDTPKSRNGRGLFWRIGAATACAVAAICVSLHFFQTVFPPAAEGTLQKTVSYTRLPAGSAANAGPAVFDQPLSLGSDSADYLLSYYPVSFNHTQAPGLVTTLRQNREQQPGTMVYSSVFEQSDQFYPVSVLNFPDIETDKVMLISSGYSRENLLHYRVVLYHDGAVTGLLSQDAVPGGSLGIQNSIIVEKRKTADSRSVSDTQISYIIPYIIDTDGLVILPLDSLLIHVGDMIILAGARPDMLEADSEKGIAIRLSGESAQPEHPLVFVAAASGDDAILLNESSSETQSKLSLNIAE